jgi:2'-5' RNA ligase
MTKKRLFIAINLPEEIKDKIGEMVEKIRYELVEDVRFLDRENWHITVTFLGYQGDEFIDPILGAIKHTAKNLKQLEIKLANIDYGPKGKTPRMIWLNADVKTSKNLAVLKENLENNLIDRGVVFKKEYRQMNAHITLARFKRARARKKLPDIKTDLNLNFQPESLDLMESHLSRSGAEYIILQAVKFKII